MRKELEEKTIRKFKGINASRSGATFEGFGPAEDQLVDVTNFNINQSLFLEKRWGIQEVCRITVPSSPTSLRIIGTQRGSPIGLSQNRPFNYVLVTDNNRVWRVNVDTGTYEEITLDSAGTPIGNLQWCVEYGGTTSTTAYTVTAIRQATGITGASGGTVSIPSNVNVSSSGWVPNTPVGTFGLVFKDRLFVLNSNGSTELAGNETKVWYSNIGHLDDFGGVAMLNFDLDFGDGDYLVAGIPFNDQLYFFKTQKTYVVSATGAPSDWGFRVASDRVGCVGRGTIKIIDGKMYFLSLEGVVRFDGAQAELISENVKDLLQTYRDFKQPSAVMNMYASHWNNKYILWIPTQSDFTYFNNALVYDIPSSTWTKWSLFGNVSAFGEAKFSDLTVDSLFLGSANTGAGKTNRLWKMSKSSWTDDGTPYNCQFITKKLDFGNPMSHKRVHSVALTVKNEPNESSAAGTYYQISTTVDNSATWSSTLTPPTKLSVTNIKGVGCKSPGRYFQSTVALVQSQAYAAVYDITFLAEERGLEPYSRPGGSTVEQVPATNIVKAGPNANDRLTSGYILR